MHKDIHERMLTAPFFSDSKKKKINEKLIKNVVSA